MSEVPSLKRDGTMEVTAQVSKASGVLFEVACAHILTMHEIVIILTSGMLWRSAFWEVWLCVLLRHGMAEELLFLPLLDCKTWTKRVEVVTKEPLP